MPLHSRRIPVVSDQPLLQPSPTSAARESTSHREFIRNTLVELSRRYARACDPGQAGREDAAGAGVDPGSLNDLDAADVADRLAQLGLADAALRHAGPPAGAARPPQVAVLGPTQVGKSTVVNALLGCSAAAVSPLAGFTVHAHGFAIEEGPSATDWADALFPGWPRRDAAGLRRDEWEAYGLTTVVRARVEEALPRCVVWDTPDFDSLAARHYRRGLLEAAANADLVVVVLSKEKYADLAAWRMLHLLAPLGRSAIVCLNKLTPEAAEAVPAALGERLREAGPPWSGAPLVTLGYVSHSAGGDLANADAVALRQCVGQCLPRAVEAPRGPGVRRFLRVHWDAWGEPIQAEHEARRGWEQLIDSAMEHALLAYRRDFLDHPQRYDSFRRVMIELLRLLELPGLAGVVHQARAVVTWPARQVLSAGRSWWARVRARDRGVRHSSEELVLREIVDRLLLRLARDAARRRQGGGPGAAVWRALSERLGREESRLRGRFLAAAEEVRQRFARQIHETAERAYERLRESPAALNTLRAGRAAADVTSIVVAVKTGGLHVNDLILAPALLAVASLLTEGALGGYLQRLAVDLKVQQLEQLRRELIEGVFRADLLALGDASTGGARFGSMMEHWQAARAAIDAWERDDEG
jgi:hypothetical protein